jgi:hypothetical protein
LILLPDYDFLMEMAVLPDISMPSLSAESPEFVRDRLPEAGNENALARVSTD